MKAVKKMTLAELAAFVATSLRENGIEVVLSGGACVTIYGKNRYVTMDLDLINVHFSGWRDIRRAMRRIGFREEGRHFRHPDAEYLVEFPSGPLAVGSEPIKQVDEHHLETGILRIISPTDCVKDRLAAYYHWNDLQCLEQASLVAGANRIDIREIERWSRVEGKLDLFRRIKNRLSQS